MARNSLIPGGGAPRPPRPRDKVVGSWLRAALEATAVAVCVWDRRGKVLYRNPAHRHLLGRGEQRGLHLADFLAPEGRRVLEDEMLPALQAGRGWQGEIAAQTPDGRSLVLWQRVDVLGDLRAATELGLGLMYDITFRKGLEEELRQSQERYLAILEDQTELICRSGPDGALTFVNEAYCRYFGKGRDELLGHAFLPSFPGQDGQELARHLASLSQDNPLGNLEHRVISPQGELRWLRWTTRAIYDDGRFSEFQSVGRDVTERRQAEEALREARDHLEQRVAQRTAALEEANQRLAQVVGELEKARDELHRLSFLDGLTGVANRRYLDAQLDSEWRRAAREEGWLGAVMVDIDHFKRYNDAYGHLAGDECLRRVAQAMAASLRRPGDFLARYGGEEFLVLLPGADLAGALALAQRLRRAVEALDLPHADSPVAPRVTVSLGVAVARPQPADPPQAGEQDLLARADRALYQAKQAGRNQVAAAGLEP